MSVNWKNIQQNMSQCRQCAVKLSEIDIVCPPPAIYPNPPEKIKVLFVGVAPPRPDDHFYSNDSDKLRCGLFSLLSKLGYPCDHISGFFAYDFFLTHTAKCPIKDSWQPDLRVSRICSQIFLRQEIEFLKPDAVCILSKSIGPLVADQLAKFWGNVHSPAIGNPATLNTNFGTIKFLVT